MEKMLMDFLRVFNQINEDTLARSAYEMGATEIFILRTGEMRSAALRICVYSLMDKGEIVMKNGFIALKKVES